MATYNQSITMTAFFPQTYTVNVNVGDTVNVSWTQTTGGATITVTPSGCSASPTTFTGPGTTVLTNFAGSSYSVTIGYTEIGGLGFYYSAIVQGTVTGSSVTAPTVNNSQSPAAPSAATYDWNFESSAQSFTGTNCTISHDSAEGSIIATATASDPQIISPTFNSLRSNARIVKMKVRRLTGTQWQGAVYFKLTTSWVGPYAIYSGTAPTDDNWQIIEWDMKTAVGPGWVDTNPNIIQYRFDLGVDSDDDMEIAWIQVGPESIGLTTTTNIALSNSGSGGTLEYNKSTTTTLPTSGWQSSSIVTEVIRGTGYYYWARRSLTDYDRTDSIITTPYHPGDLTISNSLSTSSLAWNSTIDVTATISNGLSYSDYRVVTTNSNTALPSGSVAGERIGNGPLVIAYAAGGLPNVNTTANYKIQGRMETTNGGSGSWADTNITFSISRGAGPSATLTVPSSMNEGATSSIGVSTSGGFTSGTLYWKALPASDFNPSEGTVSISSSSGSFNLTTVEDYLTEGPETATVTVYYDSSRTIAIGANTFTINDTSTATSGLYGISVYNPGGALVLAPSYKANNIIVTGNVSVPASSTSSAIAVEGLTPTNTNIIQILVDSFAGSYYLTVNRGTGSFTISNSSVSPIGVYYTALRFG